jgi:hypothetical protein
VKFNLNNIFLSVIFALIGAALVFSGLGFIKTSLSLENQPLMIVAGLMFFFAGSLVFYRSTSGPTANSLPVHAWIEYFLLLPIFLGFGFIFFWAGIVSANYLVIGLGLVTAAVMIWVAISRWPGKAKPQ